MRKPELWYNKCQQKYWKLFWLDNNSVVCLDSISGQYLLTTNVENLNKCSVEKVRDLREFEISSVMGM